MEEVKNGAFIDSLKRNNKQIREDRATAIAEDAETFYRRKVEDIQNNLRKMRRDQENMLDMSPENSMSLKIASDFSGEDYVTKDLELGIKIRNEEIRYEVAKKRYDHLFGGQV